jgi:hypothetical protein
MPIPGRVYCTLPVYDENGTYLGTCGEFLEGSPHDRAILARSMGWQLDPTPRCSGHHGSPAAPRQPQSG